VLELADAVARDANRLYAEALRQEIDKRNLTILTSVRSQTIADNKVKIVDANGTESWIEGDTVVYAVGMKPNSSVYADLYDCALEVLRIGNCIQPGTIREAVSGGYFGTREL